MPADYRSIRAGSLLRADGGYLILEARDVLQELGAWKVLVRTLRTSRLEIVPQELAFPFVQGSIKPEPIPVRLRVIMLGDPDIFYLLDSYDPDFGHLFKVLADFDTEIDREPVGLQQYAGVLARIAHEEGLPPFRRDAVCALAEHGARIASRAWRTSRARRPSWRASAAASWSRPRTCARRSSAPSSAPACPRGASTPTSPTARSTSRRAAAPWGRSTAWR
jgi:predicted ATP-dependent protease